jgi:DNA-directed DNA polymerase III PolC
MPALALTDYGGLYGTVPFYQACHAAGIQPILGMEVDTEDEDRLVLLACGQAGYQSLCHIASALGLRRRPGGPPPRCPLALLSAERAGLIALAGGTQGRLPALVRAGHLAQAAYLLGGYRAIFGADNLYVELVLHEPGDGPAVAALVRLADGLDLPVTATNEVLAARPEEAQTALLLEAIRTHTPLAALRPARRTHAARYLKPPNEMAALFADWPQALDTTRTIAQRCTVELPLGRVRFPAFALAAAETAYSRLWKLAFRGAAQRYRPLGSAVMARLQHEMTTIAELGFADYFLIVHDLVQWARRQGIVVCGRGSAVDSLVAYVLGITPVDPLQHNLYFERFLHRGRPDPPDIDLDVCWRRRSEVLAYLYDRYGAERVAMIGTHVGFGARSAYRDIAKAYGLPPDAVAGGAPFWGAGGPTPSEEARAEKGAEGVDDPVETDAAWGELYPAYAETEIGEPPAAGCAPLDRQMQADCAALAGRVRHVGIHCGGVLITQDRLADETPLLRATNGLVITQYEMNAIGALGLLKIDVLGNRALTVLAAVVARARTSGIDLNLDAIPPHDPATIALLRAGDTLGCFQLESPGMRALLRTMQPRTLNDVVVAISLFRPGPLTGGLKDLFLARLRLRGQPAYWHPRMETILEETHGVILFQEQFLQLVHEIAGFSLAEAEQLRKQLAAGLPVAAREAVHAQFRAGAVAREVPAELAEQIWSALVGYSGYGFCKGHAVAFATIAYRLAYCKAHHPAFFLAAILDEQAGFYPSQVYVEDGRRQGLRLLAPDVDYSVEGTAARGRTLRLGLGAVKGVRAETRAVLLAARRQGGPFLSLYDLLQRVPLHKHEIEALIQAGALDRLGGERSRAALLWQAHLWLADRARQARARGPRGQATLPLEDAGSLEELEALIPADRRHTLLQTLQLERAALGFTLSAHPLAPYGPALERAGAVGADALAGYAGQDALVAGWPVAARPHLTKAGRWMGFLTLLDRSGMVEVVILPDRYAALGPRLCPDGPLLVRGQVEVPSHGGAVVRAVDLVPLPPPPADDPARLDPSEMIPPLSRA